MDNDPIQNPGEKHYREEFDYLKRAETNSASDSSKPGSSSATDSRDINDLENNGSWINNTTNQFGKRKNTSSNVKARFSKLKKTSPLIVIITIIFGAGLGMSVFLSPGLLLVHIKETLTNRLDDASPALSIRTNKMLLNKLKSVEDSFSESSEGKCNIRCKFGSMSETMKRNFEDKGFKVEGEEKFGRYSVTKITFPDGDSVKTGEEFKSAMNDTSKALAFKEVFNSKTAYFLNSKFGSVLKEKFGLDKLSKLYGDTKDKVIEALRKSFGLNGDKESDDSTMKLPDEEKISEGYGEKYKALKEAISGSSAKIDKITGVAGLVCTGYDISKGITYAVKIGKIASYVAFAMTFLNAADQIKAGDAKPAVISQLGDQLTQLDSNGESATDSVGYKMAAYGDSGSLSSKNEEYSLSLASSGAAISTLSQISSIVSSGGSASLSIAQKACGVASNEAAQVATTCSDDLLAFATASIGSGGTLTVPAAAGAVVACTLKIVISNAVLSTAIGAALKAIIPVIVKNVIPVLDENTIGEAAGDVIYSGSAQILGGSAASYGLKAGNKSEIEQYALDTASINQQNDKIAYYEARKTPFDIYNQYSFLGSIANSINLSSLYKATPSSFVSSIFSLLPESLSTLTDNIYADTASKANQYGKCTDSGLQSLGIDADAFCNSSYVMSDKEMNADIGTVTQYMIDNKFVDEDSGEATAGTDYQKYIQYCSDRTDPLGETQMSISDADYSWGIGYNCELSDSSTIGQEMPYFRTYTMDKAINSTMDE